MTARRWRGAGSPGRCGILGAAALALSLTVWVLSPAAALSFREARSSGSGAFDFYVLALSWSPGFCALEGGRRRLEQCERDSGLGFVVHGLWPQNERGYPAACGPGRTPSRLALEEARGVYPDEGLARHEWRQHGTCSGKSPADYFSDVRRARDAVRVPPGLERPARDQVATPAEIERMFVEANPGLRPDMISVVCPRRVMQEVRICLDRDLRGFRRCPEVDRSGCGFGEVLVKAAR